MDYITKQKIKNHLIEIMDKILERRCVLEPFDENTISIVNPFGAALVPIEIWKGSKFERSFVTVLGQGIFEQIGKIIAEGTGAEAETQHTTDLTVYTWRLEKIDEILKAQRESRRKPNWSEEIKEILMLSNERYEKVVAISDLYIKRKDGQEEFYSFKTVKPNLDQTERAKRDMMRLIAGNPDVKSIFALPYNPAGDGRAYKNAGHTIPYRLFDMDNDNVVLIGSSLWTKIGGSENTYAELLSVFNEVGSVYRKMIRKDYLKL